MTGQELLTSNMMVRLCVERLFPHPDLALPFLQVFPMACIKRAVPWWGLAVNWIVGECLLGNVFEILSYLRCAHGGISVLFGNLAGSLFFAAVLVKCALLVISDCNEG